MFDLCVGTHNLVTIKAVDTLLYSLSAFFELHKCNLIVGHNSGQQKLQDELVNVCNKYKCGSVKYVFFKSQETIDSNQHGEMLNQLVKETTGNRVIISDPDILITSRELPRFLGKNVPSSFIVGTSYHKFKRMWQGLLPTVWFCCIDGDKLRQLNLDLRPYLVNGKLEVQNRDTAWRIAAHVIENNLKYVSFPTTDKRYLSKYHGDKFNSSLIFDTLRSIEYVFPTRADLTACIHLYHISSLPNKLAAWQDECKKIVDSCHERLS